MAGNEYDGHDVAEAGTIKARSSIKVVPYIVIAVIALWFGGLAVVVHYSRQVSLNAMPEAPRVADTVDTVPAPYPQWVVDVRGGGHEEFFEDLCRGIAFVERYADFAMPVALAGELSVDTNLPEAVGSPKVRSYAIVVAQGLYQTFTFRRSSRLHLCALATLSAWSFYDGYDLMKVLIRVMQIADLTPADLGTDVDAKAMREVLIGDLRDQLQEYRDEAKGPAAYALSVARWQASWNLTSQELFLQTGEIAAVEELAVRDKEGASVMPPR